MKRWIVYGGAVFLAVLHEDYWLWDNPRLLFGFLPVGLAWHIGISLAAAALWGLAVFWAWPKWVDRFVEQTPAGEDASRGP